MAGRISELSALPAPATGDKIEGNDISATPLTAAASGYYTFAQIKTFTSASPALVTPALGTPASGVMTNVTGTASGLTAGNVTTNANLTGHITSTGNAAILGSFTSLQLKTALTNETGSGAAVFGTSPTFITPALGTPASGVITNLTGTLAGTSGGSIGQQTIYVPAGAMEPAVTTAPAALNVIETGTSLYASRTMDFATGADDFAYFGIQMPKSWDAGTLICEFVWSATGTTANTVLWAIAATALADTDVLTTAFPTPVSPAADTNSTTAEDIMISAEVTVTVGSTPTAEDYLIFEVSRDVSGDTLAEDARLHGVRIHYTVDTGIDT